MGEKFALFFDIILIAVLVLFIYNGAKKGFVKTVLVIIGYFVALLGGLVVSNLLSPGIYDAFVRNKAEKVVEENIDNINIKSQIKASIKEQNIGIDITDEEISVIIDKGGDFAKNFSEYAKSKGSQLSDSALESKFNNVFTKNTVLKSIKDKIPENLYSEVEKYLNNSKTSISDVITALNNPSKEEGAKELTELVVKPFAIKVIKIIIFIITFILLMFVVKFLSSVITKTFKLVPLVGPLNTFLGGLLGFIQGAIIVFITALIIKVLISLTNNEIMLFNTPTIEETYIFKYIYNIKLFK